MLRIPVTNSPAWKCLSFLALTAFCTFDPFLLFWPLHWHAPFLCNWAHFLLPLFPSFPPPITFSPLPHESILLTLSLLQPLSKTSGFYTFGNSCVTIFLHSPFLFCNVSFHHPTFCYDWFLSLLFASLSICVILCTRLLLLSLSSSPLLSICSLSFFLSPLPQSSLRR